MYVSTITYAEAGAFAHHKMMYHALVRALAPVHQSGGGGWVIVRYSKIRPVTIHLAALVEYVVVVTFTGLEVAARVL